MSLAISALIERAVAAVKDTGKRTERFLPDGKRLFANDVDELVRMWWEHNQSAFGHGSTPRISPTYMLGTAQHETNFTTNEVDVEPPNSTGVCFISKGIFQIADSEASARGHAGIDLLDLENSVIVLSDIATYNLQEIIRLADDRQVFDHETEYSVRPDVWAYLSIAHNQGLGACKKTIRKYGLDWTAYKLRNSGTPFWKDVAEYGDDCISGGAKMNPKYLADPKTWEVG